MIHSIVQVVVLPISRDLLHPCAGRLLVIVGTSSGLSGSCRDARGLGRSTKTRIHGINWRWCSSHSGHQNELLAKKLGV